MVPEERNFKRARELLHEVADLLENADICGSVAIGYIRQWCLQATMDLNFYERGIRHFKAEKDIKE